MLQPDLTLRRRTSPYSALSSLNATYYQSVEESGRLPINAGENSDLLYFRIYNNFALNSGISSANNIKITTYDGSSVVSHTNSSYPVANKYVRMYQTGFGEGATIPGVLTYVRGIDTAIGYPDYYIPQWGSDGIYGSQLIRAGNNFNGVGFIEIASYMQVPENAVAGTYTFAISVYYEWSP